MPLSLPESAIKEHAPCVTSMINQALAKAKSLFLLEIPVSYSFETMYQYLQLLYPG